MHVITNNGQHASRTVLMFKKGECECMATGYLRMQARTAHEALPLGGVVVTVWDDEGRSVYELMTDENGETETVPLKTLDKIYSRDAYFTGPPFISYQVTAWSEDFYGVSVTEIPIYDGETAVLPLVLTPRTAAGRSPYPSAITVGMPAASLPGEDRQRGSMEAPYVLRQVAIPNPITVHLGSPASSAANVQVSFPDYVKNVASSEIYPTWPEAALRANIYAIVTFALNRVYTEWYKSRGYEFDITNSTAYDQYFIYGRPVYESISRIVDEIFNVYARRPGQNAPYFTSFCNGTTAVCRGLSQWGTVTLAEQGRTPLEILRYYYPKDLELVETNVITGMTSSYPGTPLRQGSRGLNVELIQGYLNRIRKNYPAIPAISGEKGVFGSATKAAVTKFQNVFGLAADGVVGRATWYKISALYAAVTKLAELDSEGNKLGIGTVPPDVLLRQGARGQDVLTLQYLLDVIGEFYPGIPDLAQDGIFGSGTRRSVIAFQRLMNLTPDGIVGPLTWKALYETWQGIGENMPPVQNTFRYTVQAGDTLWKLSQRFGTTVDAIMQANGLTGDLLQIGQVLLIPEG